MSAQLDFKYCDENLKITYIRNLPMPMEFKREYIENAMDYMPEDEDIIICSYPKTGNTWISYIVWKIMHRYESLPNLNDMTTKHIPFLELVGTEPVKSLTHPRIYKHHLPYSHMKINTKAKYIYTYRNPMDTLVSYYYFLLKVESSEQFVTFDYFFEIFLDGKFDYGNYFDHVLQFYEHKNDSHLLLISYEDLHRDTKEQILKIAKFLGKNYYQNLMENETALQEILTVTEFNYMKQNIDSNSACTESGGKLIKRDINMFRKGIVGDSKNAMKPEQIKKITNQMMIKMQNTEILNQWIT